MRGIRACQHVKYNELNIILFKKEKGNFSLFFVNAVERLDTAKRDTHEGSI